MNDVDQQLLIAAYDGMDRAHLIELIQKQREEAYQLNYRNQRLEHYRNLVEEREATIHELRAALTRAEKG